MSAKPYCNFCQGPIRIVCNLATKTGNKIRIQVANTNDRDYLKITFLTCDDEECAIACIDNAICPECGRRLNE